MLVDDEGHAQGESEKLTAHQPPGFLHLAISVFIRDSVGRVLLQRRAAAKYHFAGRWANACCSHPYPGEPPAGAATRRLAEEMGIVTGLEAVGTFTYRAEDPVSGLVEHEFDHVFAGVWDGIPAPDPAECDAWEWVDPSDLRARVAAADSQLAPWLVVALGAFPDLGA